MLEDDGAGSGRVGESSSFFTLLVTLTAVVSGVTEAVRLNDDGTALGLDMLSTWRLVFRMLGMVLVKESGIHGQVRRNDKELLRFMTPKHLRVYSAYYSSESKIQQ